MVHQNWHPVFGDLLTSDYFATRNFLTKESVNVMIFLNDVPTWNTRGFRAVGVLTGFLWGHEEPQRWAYFQTWWKGLFKTNLEWWLRLCLLWSKQCSKHFTSVFTLNLHNNPMGCRYSSPHLRDEKTKAPLTSFQRPYRLEEGPKIGYCGSRACYRLSLNWLFIKCSCLFNKLKLLL